jgi:hypothetical protein
MPVGQGILSIIAAHTGPVYSLGDTRTIEARERLAEFGLEVAPGTCAAVTSRLDRFSSCPLERF